MSYYGGYGGHDGRHPPGGYHGYGANQNRSAVPNRMPMPMPTAGYGQVQSQIPGYQPPAARNSPQIPRPTPAPTFSSTQYPSTSTSSSAGYTSRNNIRNIGAEIEQSMNTLIDNLSLLVKEATAEELTGFLDNETKIIELVEDAAETKQMAKKRTELTERNRERAVENMSLKPELEVEREALISSVEEQNRLKAVYMDNQQRLGATSQSLDDTHALLLAATSQKETESDDIANAFLDGNKSMEDFLSEFVSERTLYHTRKVKADKMSEIIRQGPRGGQFSQATPIPLPRPQTHNTYNYGGQYGGY